MIALFRFIDFWVGIPLCFILTPVYYLRMGISRIFGRENSAPQKILVIKLIELGAVIHAYPLFKKIQEEYPLAEVHILTFSKSKGIFDLFEGHIRIKQMIIINEDGLFSLIRDIFKALVKLIKLRPDVVIDLEFFIRASSLFTCLSFSKKSVGFYRYGFEGLYRGDFLTHKILYNPLRHVTVNYLSLVNALKEDEKNSPESAEFIDEKTLVFPIYISKEEALKSLSIFNIPVGKRLFLMNAGEGTIPLREWPLENFKSVAQAILSNENNFLLLVGTAGANLKAVELMRGLNGDRVINLCGKTNLSQLMEIFLMGDSLLTNDGGLGHLAMLTPIKKFVLFGPETPQVFAPLGRHVHVFYSHWPCSPCLSALNHRYSSCKDNRCLSSIKAQQVIDVINAHV